MTTISYTEAREKFAAIWDDTVATREPITLSRRGHKSVVLVALEEWEGLQETAHLLRSPANARRLLSALGRLNQGEGQVMEMDDLAGKVHE